jgi:farnesyl-diphosphate farnesyltransferase
LIYIVIATVGTVVVITSLMVCVQRVLFPNRANTWQIFTAWMAGARFDIAYTQAKLEFGKFFGNGNAVAQVTEVHETLDKSEL